MKHNASFAKLLIGLYNRLVNHSVNKEISTNSIVLLRATRSVLPKQSVAETSHNLWFCPSHNCFSQNGSSMIISTGTILDSESQEGFMLYEGESWKEHGCGVSRQRLSTSMARAQPSKVRFEPKYPMRRPIPCFLASFGFPMTFESIFSHSGSSNPCVSTFRSPHPCSAIPNILSARCLWAQEHVVPAQDGPILRNYCRKPPTRIALTRTYPRPDATFQNSMWNAE